MSSPSTDRKPLVDYGVQIRFIKDLHDTGGGFPDKSKVNGSTATPPSSKYGVAVRVQGISGQPRYGGAERWPVLLLSSS
ncbi:hypothetical protein CesoFtcFv8_020259 [Champsocephalus esox]|uniref:Uncharacterized protein n=1 Tax=Champsocephalus esox TaxID=159716 RepID=A0AAN8BEZ9_9TELE|nr:hypothetical protein CesoFtcFv8_020259 [Champsocephalus esox]